MSNLKICIVGPNLSMGGMERASATMANSLTDYSKVSYVSLFKKEVFFNLKREVAFFEPTSFNINSLNFLKTIVWLRKKIQSINPDKIIVFHRFYGAILLLSLLGKKYDIYISERTSPFNKPSIQTRVISKFIFSFLKPKGVISQTTIASEYQKKYYGSSRVMFAVIHNILKPITLYPNIERQNTILAVGRIDDYLKGFDRLLIAFSKIKNKSWKLVFAGSDKPTSELKELSTKLAIDNRINFVGKVKDIDLEYAKASIFVIPSRSEGFPNALCEAMAAGLACVSFDFTAGPRDIIENKVNGMIVEDGNIEMLAEAIDMLIQKVDFREKISEKAKEVGQKFEQSKITKELLDFINI